MTAIGWLIVLALVAYFVMLALRLGPVYMEYFAVSDSIESLKDEPALEGMVVTQRSRLSVQPVEKEHFEKVLAMADEGEG